jgi:hypothetical protein
VKVRVSGHLCYCVSDEHDPSLGRNHHATMVLWLEYTLQLHRPRCRSSSAEAPLLEQAGEGLGEPPRPRPAQPRPLAAARLAGRGRRRGQYHLLLLLRLLLLRGRRLARHLVQLYTGLHLLQLPLPLLPEQPQQPLRLVPGPGRAVGRHGHQRRDHALLEHRLAAALVAAADHVQARHGLLHLDGLAVVQDEHDGAHDRRVGRDLHLADTGERQVQQHGESLVRPRGGRRQHAAEALDDAGGHEERDVRRMQGEVVQSEERVQAAGVAAGAVFPQAFDEDRDGVARTDDGLGLRDAGEVQVHCNGSLAGFRFLYHLLHQGDNSS